MRKFDYSFLNNGLLPANLVNLTANIFSLKTMAGVRKDEYSKIFTELEAVAKVQFIKSSNAIEGIVTLNEIHLGFEHIDFRGRDIRRVRFRPAPADETPKAMEQLVLAYMEARSDANVNQLLLIPCVILDFLCIHPFRDGNGGTIKRIGSSRATRYIKV